MGAVGSRAWGILVAVGVVLSVAGCAPERPLHVSLNTSTVQAQVYPPTTPYASPRWRIGFDRRLEPKEDVRQIASLARWLERRTGLPFYVHITPSGMTIVDELCAGEVDFAAVGTVSYLQAHDRCGVRILVRGRNREGKDRYRAAIIVPPTSDLQTLSDLRGRSFAFGAPNSTQGHLIPRLMLRDAGIALNDLSAFAFHDSHVATANAVISGRYDAGAVQDTLAYSLAARGLVRILALSDDFPSSGVVVAPHVPDKTVQLVRDALLALDPAGKDAAVLYRWDRTEMPLGFAPARDEEYAALREIARQIGILEPSR